MAILHTNVTVLCYFIKIKFSDSFNHQLICNFKFRELEINLRKHCVAAYSDMCNNLKPPFLLLEQFQN